MPRLTLAPRAILLDVVPPQMEREVATRRLLELEALTRTYGGLVIVKLIQKRALPDYRTYVGRGKLDEIITLAKKEKVDLLVINNLLKPKQMFEIGEILRPHNLRVWDRVDLILKIFDKNAKTAEAKLQIKLAAIRHMGPRIFGMGLEMMQQTGGIGTRGQGETNTEIMRRHLAQQEEQTKKQLDRVAASRSLHRLRRDRLRLKTISVVGYTNAGKSSLVNALTRKGALVANKLFATLDTQVGKMWLPQKVTSDKLQVTNPSSPTDRSDLQLLTCNLPLPVLVSDTIGFIQDLPPQLISAFQSTLDETVDADLLLQVIDVNDPYLHQKIAEVEEVLEQLGVAKKPRIFVFNKIDVTGPNNPAALQEQYSFFAPVCVSAEKGLGLEELKNEIARRLS